MGHEDKDCHAFYLMRECTSYMYIIQEENVAVEGGGKYNNPRGFNQENKGGFYSGQGREKFIKERRGPII
jgi:hypothetical protein